MYVYCIYYNIPIEIPPVENLTVVDKCANVTASWNITERHCEGLSYSVTLSSVSDGVILEQFITNDTTHTFTDTDIKAQNGNLRVNVFGFNRNVIGNNSTVTATIGISKDG